MRNEKIDFFKGIACIAVLMIHISFPGKVGGVLINFSRFAVPFFFMVSGYFLPYDINNPQYAAKLIKKRKELIILALVWGVFYILFNILFIENQGLDNYALKVLNAQNAFYFTVLNWTTPYLGVGHLWYIFALIYVYTIMIKLWDRRVHLSSNVSAL